MVLELTLTICKHSHSRSNEKPGCEAQSAAALGGGERFPQSQQANCHPCMLTHNYVLAVAQTASDASGQPTVLQSLQAFMTRCDWMMQIISDTPVVNVCVRKRL